MADKEREALDKSGLDRFSPCQNNSFVWFTDEAAKERRFNFRQFLTVTDASLDVQ